MKKTAFLVILLLALTFISPVFALEPSLTTYPNAKGVLTQKQERLEDLKAKIASREAEFGDRIAKFKDKIKAQIATTINSLLSKVNKQRTDQMNKNLDKMSEILSKL